MSLVTRLAERLRTSAGLPASRALPVPPVGFTDGTIALRPWRPSDGLDLATLCDDDEIRRWTSVPRDYRTHVAARRAAFAEEERLEGRGTYFAITDARDAVLLGAVDLIVPGPGRELGRIAFLLGADARGHGHATRAVELLAGWAFSTVGVGTLEIRPRADNAAAVAVATRTGFAMLERGPGPDGRLRCIRRA